MKINSGHMVRKMRKEMKLSQEELAERLYVSTRQVSRIENGEAEVDLWQFLTMLELLGRPSEDFWLLYLDSIEYEEYRLYRKMKRLLREGLLGETKEVLDELEDKGLTKRPFISQFIAYARIQVQEDLPHDDVLRGLDAAIRMSRPDFDENKVAGYRMTYNEIFIVSEIAARYSLIGDMDKSARLYGNLIRCRENARASEDDKAAMFPPLMFNLSTLLGRMGRFKESMALCEQALKICKEYNNLRFVPGLLYNIASCYHSMGEEEQIYKPYLVRAYHCAYAIGNNEEAVLIKKDAENSFGISVLKNQ